MPDSFKHPDICPGCHYNSAIDRKEGKEGKEGKEERKFYFIAKGKIRIWLCSECYGKIQPKQS